MQTQNNSKLTKKVILKHSFRIHNLKHFPFLDTSKMSRINLDNDTCHKQYKHQLSILIVLVLSMSIAIFTANYYWFRFPGLFYFDTAFLGAAILLFMVHHGLKLQFGWRNDMVLLQMIREANIYATIITVILFATSAVQYTPFNPIDKQIISIEHYLHLDLQASIAWLNQHLNLKSFAIMSYNSLSYQLFLIPIIVLLLRQYDALYQFYFLCLITWLIGSMIYFFFPTTAPASVIDSPYFMDAQRATGLKFWQLHHYIQPLSAEGGLIAMPSFHVIWAWLCTNLVRSWPPIFVLIGSVNLILVFGCVFLGWHYFLDVLGSIATLLISHYIYRLSNKIYSTQKVTA